MTGAILEGMPTYLPGIFSAIQDTQLQYNWLITDIECFPPIYPADGILYTAQYMWMTGETLSAKVQQDINFQWWNWAVFSGFEKTVPLHTILKADLPFADGNTALWKKPVHLQHPLAIIEIIAWDNTCTFCISKEDILIRHFRKAFPRSEDLCAYNDRR